MWKRMSYRVNEIPHETFLSLNVSLLQDLRTVLHYLFQFCNSSVMKCSNIFYNLAQLFSAFMTVILCT